MPACGDRPDSPCYRAHRQGISHYAKHSKTKRAEPRNKNCLRCRIDGNRHDKAKGNQQNSHNFARKLKSLAFLLPCAGFFCCLLLCCHAAISHKISTLLYRKSVCFTIFPVWQTFAVLMLATPCHQAMPGVKQRTSDMRCLLETIRFRFPKLAPCASVLRFAQNIFPHICPNAPKSIKKEAAMQLLFLFYSSSACLNKSAREVVASSTGGSV